MLLLLRWLGRSPLWFLHALGGVLGWLAYAASPAYRARVVAHARLAGVAPAARRASVAEAGRMVAELPRVWLRARGAPIADPVRWEGDAALEAMLERARGAVILTPHLGSFEVAAQAYAERFGARWPATVLYRPARQPWLRRLEETARARPHLATAPATLAGVRQLLRALKRGEAVGLLPDQVPPDGLGVWAPFYGRPAYTMTLAARLARQTGAALGLLWCERLPRGAGYVVRVEPFAEPWGGADGADGGNGVKGAADDPGDDAADAAAINRAMERLIGRRPSQYLWGYARYKRPRREAFA